MSSKGGQTTTSTQSNEPPAWARPLLEKGASEAMNLYNSGSGYNVYNGPTQAGMSDPTLSGMNSLLAATGYKGAPVQNQSPEQMFPQVMAMLQQQQAQRAQKKQQPAAAAPDGVMNQPRILW